ncbi:MAG: FAD-dependent oxidoreductase, partial [Anaerolineales bacterium]|nr:FAD-dependent oxidoreductase [Anaerolineales bacterium]
PGQMWRAAADRVSASGGQVHLNTQALTVRHAGGRVLDVTARQDAQTRVFEAAHVISSMPLSELILKLDPPAPPAVLAAARGLTYRDFLTVILLVRQPELFPDNWIYIHSPEVHVGRVQNFKNWSPEMVPDPATTSLGLEYFVNEGDALWTMADRDLIALGQRELAQIGLVQPADVFDGLVIRQPKAYPVYNSTYARYLETLKAYLAGFENLQTIGRNGLHKYNNQDHSMLTAMLAVRNLAGERHDVWDVNTERSYHEELRLTPHSALSADEAGAET